MALRIIGHRANSLRILLLYKLYRVEHVEVDVSPGPSGEPIVMHGPSEIRRASIVGRIFSYIDYKLFYRDPITRPKRLEDWMTRLDWASSVILDIKPGVDLAKLDSALRESGYPKNLIEVSSSDHELLAKARRLVPGVELVASFSDRIVGLEEYARSRGFGGVAVKYSIITGELVESLKESSIRVYAWTVNEPGEAARLKEMGIDGIITDVPWLIRKRLGRG